MTNNQVKMESEFEINFPQNFSLLILILISFFGVTNVAQAVNCNVASAAQINTITPLRTLGAGAEHIYKVTAPSDGLLSPIVNGGLSTYIQILDKDCLPVNNSSYYFQQASQPVAKGINYVRVYGSSSTVTGNYKLQIDGDFETDDRGSNCDNASVARKFLEQGALKPFGDQDFFQIKVGNKSRRLIASIEGGISAYIRVLDKDCITPPGESYYFLNMDRVLTTPGVYYVKVYGTSNTIKGLYNLRLSGDIVFPTGSCNGKAATISGTNASEIIPGTAGKDVIQGFGGNDLISGLAGDDIICGGDGNDMIQGGDGADQLIGEGGDDMLDGGTMNDSLNGGLGSDMCNGGAQTDVQSACEFKSFIP